VYSQLGVWVDANSDGISEAGEVRTLASLGITEISVTAQVTTTQDHGNTIGLTSSYQTADGVSHLAGDVWFAAQDAASYATLSALSTATVAALRTDQLSALSTVQVQALTTGDLVALQTQSLSALGDASAMAPLSAASVRSASANAPQVAVASDQPSNASPQDLAVALASGLAQRASALAQAIGTFDVAGAPRGVSTPSLSVPVDAYGATMRSATLAVGNLVNQMRSFDSQAASAVQSGMGTAAPSALTAMQVAPIGMLDPLKQAATNDFASLSGIDLKR
jgi:trimeric autotransporter adhesin